MIRQTALGAGASILAFLLSGCDPAFTRLQIRNDSEISLCIVVKNIKGKVFLEGPGIRPHTTDEPALLMRPWESLLDREGRILIEFYDARDWDKSAWKLRDGAQLLRQITVTREDLDKLDWLIRYP